MENTVITGALPAASDADGDTLAYSLVSPVTGLVLNPNGTFSYTPAANFHGSVGFQYVAKDPSGASSAAQTFAITVNSSNKAPASLDLTGNKIVSENVAIGTVVGALLATDPDGDALTYTLTDNAGGLFKIDGNTIVTAQAIDYEALASKNGTITVEARDPENLAITKSFIIAVADVNEPASILSLSKASVREDVAVGTTVGTFTAVDPENGELSYLLTDSAGGLFKLDGTTLVTAKALDYDKVQSDTVTLEVTDPGGLKTSQVFTISISDVMETTVGSNASQIIKGGAGADKIDGKGGNDTLYGLGGNDLLYGGAGNDKLYGGLGSDKLFGGTGNDTFVFNTKLGADNVDTIDDFSVSQDVIWLDDDIFSKVGKVGDLSGAAFYAGKAAHDATDRIIYDKPTGKLFYDADGNGKGQAIQIALLDKGLALTAHHFDIIA
jgi:Ca2+-binding RTX toxin-like protein